MNAMSQQKPLTNFLSRVRLLDGRLADGLSRLVPDWWNDKLNDSPGISQQVIFGLAKFANIDLNTVITPGAQLRFNESVCRYKHAANKSVEELQAATAVVHGIAKIAAAVVKDDYNAVPSAFDIRQLLLQNGNPWIDFKTLLEYCWSIGIPVLYMPELPASKKMDAVVIKVQQRPVIALTKKQKHASSLLFSLAHELGHIACGHLEDNSLIIDEKINEDDVDNPLERDANSFAIELLTGNPDAGFNSERRISAQNLASESLRIAKERKIDPGHVALNYAKTMDKKGINCFAVSFSALNILYPILDWQSVINSTFLKHVDEEMVTEDKFEILRRINNIEV